MKVHDVMKQAAVCCRSDANVGAAVELLWVNNCGMLPVVGKHRKASRSCHGSRYLHCNGNAKPSGGRSTTQRLPLASVTCKPEDEIHEATGCIQWRRNTPPTSLITMAGLRESCPWTTSSLTAI